MFFEEFKVELTDITAKKGEDITFYCEAKTKVNAKWMKGNVPLENGGRITISEREKQIFTLKISKVTEEDIGQYTIVLSNYAGSTRAKATAKLFGKHLKYLFEKVICGTVLVVQYLVLSVPDVAAPCI